MGAKMMLRLMLAAIFWWNSKSCSHFPTFPSYVVSETISSNSARIIGPNGHCVAVKGGDYKDGNDIILSPCKSGSDVDQTWSYESDGTIRSNGMCLTCYGYSNQGTRIHIYSCNKGEKFDKTWQMRENGQIVNSESGLVLSAISGNPETILTVETNIFSSFQNWRLDNFEWSAEQGRWITGFGRRCMYVSGEVSMEECTIASTGKYWVYFPDKTIRPWKHPTFCLSFDNFTGKRVIVVSCGLGPTSERWVFTSSGAVLNERVDLVMEVRGSKEIILAPATELPNQIWDIVEPRG